MEYTKPTLSDDCCILEEKHVPFRLDPAGYVLIRIAEDVKDGKHLEIGFCKNNSKNTIEVVTKGIDPEKIYRTFIKNIPALYPEHYSYIGDELRKAKVCMDNGTNYVQDD
ncbi:hypothetical protein H6503_05210 [Candidatus Woesearchaeota archaeon]|nr:hypothetical protein [Candidatus Woesearchaeota archaeon]